LSTLNLGILAHVDAGKTSLTERLLYTAGAIDEIGSVDSGSTQTDTLALERARGITIRSAVASFTAGGDTVNLIDTPGHPDFIAEVERVLGVLDGVVLVVSAVEGVQAQTRVLMRVLRRLRIPTLIFVNKIDRRGARIETLLPELAAALSTVVVPMGTVRAAGTPSAEYAPAEAVDLAERLAEHDDAILADVVEGRLVPSGRLRAALAEQTAAVAVQPVFFGSAITGAGVGALVDGARALLPRAGGDPDAPLSGTVFSVERGPAGEKIANVRLFAGTVRVREKLPFGDGHVAKVTALEVVGAGDVLTAGRIGRLWGLADVRVGDPVGTAPSSTTGRQFAPPTLETVVVPENPGDRGRLYAALAQLAEQDPLINVRQDDLRQEVSVSLYGEVQKEVIQATLATDFGVPVGFRETTTLCVERPAGTGTAVEYQGAAGNPFKAGLGLRVEPGPAGSGVRFGLGIERGSLTAAFITAVEQTVRRTLREGLSGWPVTDCVITLTHSSYTPPPPGTGWSVHSTSATDFRNLTPLVLAAALRRAGTRVYEPVHRFTLEIPADTVGVVQPLLGRLGGPARSVLPRGREYVLDGDIPAARMHELELALPALTHGEAVLDAAFDHYEPTRGAAPTRPRTDHNPLNRKEYLLRLNRH
jgi:ribosomal protection tetracycline resistance protein